MTYHGKAQAHGRQAAHDRESPHEAGGGGGLPVDSAESCVLTALT